MSVLDTGMLRQKQTAERQNRLVGNDWEKLLLMLQQQQV